MVVERATLADAEALASLVNQSYRGAEAARGWAHEADLLDGQRTDATMLRGLMHEGATILMAKSADRVMGCVCVTPDDEGSHMIGMLTVAPDAQTQGLGRKLLASAERLAETQGAQRVTMTVIHLRHSLIAWYERRGYVRTGATAPFPADPRFGRPLLDDLHFVVLSKTLPPRA